MKTTTSEVHGEISQGGWSGRGSLEQLVAELDRQKESRIDFVADTSQMMMDVVSVGEDSKELRLCPDDDAWQLREFLDRKGVPLRKSALDQVGQKSTPTIPGRFLSDLAEVKPYAAADLVNAMFADGNRRFVRCLDGRVRAFLGERYRVLDNYDLAFTALESVRQLGGEIFEASLSDTHMRLKFTTRQIWESVNEKRQGPQSTWYAGGMGNQEFLSKVAARSGGDLPGGPGTVHPVVTISNSETGHGGMHVRVGILRAICFNLATVETVASRIHAGEKLDVGRWSEETQSAESRSIMLKCRDAIRMAFNVDSFKALVRKIEKSQERVIEAPGTAVDNVIGATTLAEGDRDRILEYFVADYERTAYGLSQAVARYAQDTDDADKGNEIEEIAGKLMLQPALVGNC